MLFSINIFVVDGQTVQKIGNNSMIINSSAVLELESTTKGFLPPRMTIAQRNAIESVPTGLIVYCTDCGTTGEPQFYNGTQWLSMFTASTNTYYNTVISSSGRVWMDRNLGATQMATSSTDTNSYGDLYQWGRGADEHQLRTSTTTTTLSSTDQPGNPNFIISVANAPYDWRAPQNDNLWKGVNGINNPCPAGYRLPTEIEFDAERTSWTGGNNAAGAFGSALKLPMPGFRDTDGSFSTVDSFGYYWTSTVSGTNASYLYFSSSDAGISNGIRVYGISVRCLKD